MTGNDESKFTRLAFPTGAFLVKEGETGDAAYVIVSGNVEIRKGELGKSPDPGGSYQGRRDRGDVAPRRQTSPGNRRHLEGMDPVMPGIVGMLVEKARETADDLLRRGEGVNWTSWRRED